MSTVSSIFKIIAQERVTREMEQKIAEQIKQLEESLIGIGETAIHRKHISKETSKFIYSIRKTYENAYILELIKMYDSSEISLLSAPFKKQNPDWIKEMDGAPYKYILVWYDGINKKEKIGFAGYTTYQESVRKIIQLIAENNIKMKDVFLLEDVFIMIDIEAILLCEI
jgi:hypothetical protein